MNHESPNSGYCSFGEERETDQNLKLKDDEKKGIIELKSKLYPRKKGRFFKLFREDKQLKFLKKEKHGVRILNFDMSKLEMEYDYDTD